MQRVEKGIIKIKKSEYKKCAFEEVNDGYKYIPYTVPRKLSRTTQKESVQESEYASEGDYISRGARSIVDKLRGVQQVNLKSVQSADIKTFVNAKAKNTQKTTKNNEKMRNFTQKNDKQAEKCVIYCPEEKVKTYAEIIKNSDMQPVAVIPKITAEKQTKLTFKKVLVLLVVGVIIGFVNGFFGGGGGMLCVPLLVFVLGLKDKVSHATAILIMLPISIVSLIVYISNFTIEFDTALFVTIGSITGGILGSLLLKKLSNVWIRAIFALIMIGAGFKMIF